MSCMICQSRATRGSDVCAACAEMMQPPRFHEDEPDRFGDALALMALRERNYNKVARRRREKIGRN